MAVATGESHKKLSGHFAFLRTLAQRIGEHDCVNGAAQMAYYFVLALFPALIVFAALTSYFPLAQSHSAIHSITSHLPASSRGFVLHIFSNLHRSREAFLSFGIVTAIWSASTGIASLTDGLNKVYEVREERGYIRKRLLAIGVFLALCVFFLAAFILQVSSGTLAAWLQAQFHGGAVLQVAWHVVEWAVAIFLMIVGISLIESVLPNAHRPWRWISAGGTFFVIISILASIGFRAYIQNFTHYTTAYGTLGAFFVLMIWIYLESLIILVSGEINAELYRSRTAPSARTALGGSRAA